MKLQRIFKGANSIAITGALIFLSMLSGCGDAGGAGDKGNTNGGASQSADNNSIQVTTVSPTPTALNAPPTDKTIPQATAPARNNNAQVNTAPKPQIGSGGNDFFQFTQARAAIGADPDLKTTNIVVDVKGGVVTLSGTVASAAQKSKAEQLMRGVAGVKTVNNGLQIQK